MLAGRVALVGAIVAIASLAPALADTVELKGGTVVNGTYVGGRADEFHFDIGASIQIYRRPDVAALTFGSTPVVTPENPGANDVLELSGGRKIVGKYIGGSKSEIRMNVDGKDRGYPLGDVSRLVLAASTTAATPPPPPPPAKKGGKSGGGGSRGKRWYFGGGIGAAFGNVTFVSVSPILGYRLSKRGSLGVGLIYRYRQDDRFGQTIRTNDYGGSVFGRYRFMGPAFAQLEYEWLSYEYVLPDLATDRDAYPSLFGGVGFSQKIGKNGSWFLLGLYNFLYDDDDIQRPYDSPWLIRVGVGFGF